MATRIVLTAGLNELPLLISAFASCREAHAANQPLPEFSVLCSDATREEAGRVRDHLHKRLQSAGLLAASGRLTWDVTAVEDAHLPEKITKGMGELLKNVKEASSYELHYTGGTAAMGVHAFQALADKHPRLCYVSAEARKVFDEKDREIGKPSGDERFHWQLSIEDLADLHGYATLQAFQPDTELLSMGVEMAALMADDKLRNQYREWLGKYKEPFSAIYKTRDPRELAKLRPRMAFHWPRLKAGEQPRMGDPAAPRWDALMSQAAARLAQDGTNLLDLSRGDRDKLSGFIHNQYFELACYAALQRAVDGCGVAAGTDIRHSVKLRLRPTKEKPQPKDFELDVTAICGYELLVASCSAAAGETIKQKGFEAAHRARQIGGSSAQAIVLCMDEPSKAALTQDELQDDIGGRSKAPKIWGKDICGDPARLKDKLVELFGEMKWKK